MTNARIPGRVALLALALFAFCKTGAANAQTNGVDRLSPDFVTVSLLDIGPGTDFFSCFGHVCLRLECPSYGLDYCFSSEGEPIGSNIVRFVKGELRTGRFLIPTRTFLRPYEKAGRGCRRYVLDLPPDAEQRLWKILDDQVRDGRDMPYDYIRNSCVQTVLRPLMEALLPYRLDVSWERVGRKPQRAMLSDDLAWRPWTRFVLHTIVGTEVDRDVRTFSSVLHPTELVGLLRNATIDGRPVLTGEGEVMMPFTARSEAGFVTPLFIAWIVLALAVLDQFRHSRIADAFFLFLQNALGIFIIYLIFAAPLPATDWNWLIVPFNALPLVFHRWRRYWALPFSIILVILDVYLTLSPYAKTDPAYSVLIAAYAVFHFGVFSREFGTKTAKKHVL